MNLTRHFTLTEMVHTQHRLIDNTPSDAVIENLRLVCEDLEVIRREFGPLRISSGYRCAELNTAVGGSKKSSHIPGAAADIIPLRSGVGVSHVLWWLKMKSTLTFDQAIDEYGWLHYSVVPIEKVAQPRFQTLRYRKGKYTQC